MLSLTSAALSFSTPALVPAAPSRAVGPAMSVYSWSQPGEGMVWDPLKLAKTPEKFERLRYVEVKHGRVAMLAFLGHVVVGSGFRFPGQLSNGLLMSDIEGTGFAALKASGIDAVAVIFVTCAFLEMRVFKEVVKGEHPGDLRNGLFKEGWDGLSDSDKKRKINIELNNGRAAMMGILGCMVHEQLLPPSPVISTHIDPFALISPHIPHLPSSPAFSGARAARREPVLPADPRALVRALVRGVLSDPGALVRAGQPARRSDSTPRLPSRGKGGQRGFAYTRLHV